MRFDLIPIFLSKPALVILKVEDLYIFVDKANITILYNVCKRVHKCLLVREINAVLIQCVYRNKFE